MTKPVRSRYRAPPIRTVFGWLQKAEDSDNAAEAVNILRVHGAEVFNADVLKADITKCVSVLRWLHLSMQQQTQREAVPVILGHLHGSHFMESITRMLVAGTISDQDVQKWLACVQVALQTMPSVAQWLGPSVAICQVGTNKSKELQELAAALMAKIQDRSREELGFQTKKSKPPDDYRTLPVLPSQKDLSIQTQDVFVRPNVVKGAFSSTEEYLDIHFRLMREDFLAPFRESFQAFVDKGTVEPGSGVFAYYDTEILRPIVDTQANKLRFILRLHDKYKNIAWSNSRKLLFGNLICLSPIGQQTAGSRKIPRVLFFTVANRDRLQKYLELQVSTCHDEEAALKFMRKYPVGTLFESASYYDAYRPVLEALQRLDDSNMPLKEELVSLRAPAIPVTLQGKSLGIQNLLCDLKHPIAPEQLMFRPGAKLAVPCASIGLNEMQTKAVELAMKSRVALIQGPPGTGKSYVGCKLMQLLLSNKEAISKKPILMVCYTNHALDQFLELLVKSTQSQTGILRVGARSQSQILEGCMLSKKRRDIAPSKCFGPTRYNLGEKRAQLLQQWREKQLCLKHSYWPSVEDLLPYMFEGHSREIRYVGNFVLEKWLGVDPRSLEELRRQYETELIVEPSELSSGFDAEKMDEEPQPEAEETLIENERRFGDSDSEEIVENMPRSHPVAPQLKAARLIPNSDSKKPKSFQGRPGYCHALPLLENAEEASQDFLRIARSTSLAELTMTDREYLFQHWVSSFRKGLVAKELSKLLREISQIDREFEELRMQGDKEIFEKHNIIAMTTTGAAKYNHVLQDVGPEVVIIEEAAEVFEAHLVASLNPQTKHLILIGDHVQLRPNPNMYRSAVKFKMDVSLFERLLNNNFEHVRLQEQHRMKPTISKLLRVFYDDLTDHATTLTRPRIRGVPNDLAFISHKKPEGQTEHALSKRNEYEASMALAMARYFMQQGYDPEQITILALYLGQRQLISQKVHEENWGDEMKRVAVIVCDSFQGNENDIVILSLVRSNEELKIGFLKVINRVCVALSRARNGLFILGNEGMLRRAEGDQNIWLRIFSILEQDKAIHEGFKIQCAIHGTVQVARSAEDLGRIAPEGGCQAMCNSRLNCGHTCPRACHAYDIKHTNMKCEQRCGQKLMCGHRCRAHCHYPMPCSEACKELITRQLPCSHVVETECWQPYPACKRQVLVTLACGHDVQTTCHAAHLDRDSVLCHKPCTTVLQCGCCCTGDCSKCVGGMFHQPCQAECKRVLDCGHECARPCPENCSICVKRCETKCIHSACGKLCFEPCKTCEEQCAWRCDHQICTRKCGEPCDRTVCPERCLKKLPKCGHQCIGGCGDPCPSECRVCDREVVTEIFFGDEDEENAIFVKLPDCGHLISVEGLDQWIDQKIRGRISWPRCPKCSSPIRSCVRYTSQLNKIAQNLEIVKLKSAQLHVDQHYARSTLRELSTKFLGLLTMVSQKEIASIRTLLTDLSISRSRCICTWEIESVRYGITIVEEFNDIEKAMCELTVDANTARQFKRVVKEATKCLLRWMPSAPLNEQQRMDLEQAVRLCGRMKDITIMSRQLESMGSIDPKYQRTLEKLKRIATYGKPFTPERDQEFRSLWQILEAVQPVPLTKQERAMIREAMGVPVTSHWYTCPNGHFYFIDDCGQAMVTSQCPDCRQEIGGAHHTLLETNRVASDF
eukprot:Gregarina_sp_Poly_1__1439@NODE_135_length_13154_cov_22_841446_g120_i0_p1_GENE_NODE_135_length_13154_cov_22_841446_g120_i0NODE_135_length_13154_cov_22_841446_g120_i0_p1_ORF_typecomplete_len1687_score199_08AAA_12/PF13087_6/1_6e47AAA_12/PF13087_6/7_4e03AAA_11/PF13086_6/7_1e46AAA_30/PF13604_6/2_5e09AAA_30/PF13604_6/0_0043AAA_19/PF13245_6/1_1e12AAA_19/PF13245_6/5_3e03Viral_helicase1/PF01443_18/1_4e02Viral_helicase1/PF01443_18/2_8e07Viral_helicase1/PF01443_18/2_2e03ResIII/PF04851_15/5_1e05ResIII/PF048